jgi:hypothetical protein
VPAGEITILLARLARQNGESRKGTYDRLLGYEIGFQNREHFLNVASTAMRRLLINRARRLKAAKRQAFQSSVPLEGELQDRRGV